MFDYKGESCPCCEKSFHVGDDIAVCPECGAPHHRACYTVQGRCFYEEQHETGFDWSAERRARERGSDAADTFVCPHCSRSVSRESRFCNFCGTSFEQPLQSVDPQEIMPSFLFFGSRDREETTSEKMHVKEFDGIPIADWLKYIGRNAALYLNRFSYQDITGRKTWFMLSAALCPPVYFFYRKMWWWAIIATLINTVFKLPTIALLLNNAGFLLAFDQDVLVLAANYLSYISWATNLTLGLFSMHFYRHSAARRMRRIKLRSGSEQAYQSWLERASGPSLFAALLLPGAILLGGTVINLLGSM